MGCTPIYVITTETKAIIAKDSSYYRSRILEQGEREARFSIYKAENIIDYSCIVYGASLEGRRNAVAQILKTRIKLPIPVSPVQNVYMFPTASTRKKDCVWLSYYHIDDYEQRDDKTYVAFHDGSGLYVNTSKGTLDAQFKKASQVIAQMNRLPI